MRSMILEKAMKDLGLAFLLGLFLQIRIQDRNILLPFFAIACVMQLEKLERYRALSESPWFATARGCGYGVIVLGFAAWLPQPFGGTAGALGGAAIFLGAAGYAGALRDWSVLQGWAATEAKARSAMQWTLATLGITVLALLVHLVVAQPGATRANPSSTPSTVFGRPLVGWGPGVALLIIAVVSIVSLVKLRATSQLIRHSLRAQPDALLVEA